MRKFVVAAAAGAMLTLFALPVFAESASPAQCGPPTPGQTYTCTMHFRDQAFPPMPVAPVVCPDGSTVPGGVLAITVANGVVHITINKAGDVWDTGTIEGSFTFTADTGVVYTGHFEQWFGDSVNNRNEVHHFVANFVGTGADGSRLSLHILFHLSTTPNGEVLFFDKTHC